MFKTLFYGVLIVLASTLSEAGSSNMKDQVKEVVLDNGMRVLLVNKPGAPNIAAGWVAHVGSANERPGITGISHLFEHMMFKGSSVIGTKDNHLDSKIRQQLDDIRQKMFDEEKNYRDQFRHGIGKSISDPALETDAMKALKVEFEKLIKLQRENMVKDEFDKVYTEAGASGMNAFTNQDMTVYFIQIPKNKLEFWFWMESERLFQPVFREFYSERDVVFEERRMRTESTPTGVQNEVFNSLFWRGSSYAWPVVGWPSDIAAITREQAENYFDIFYAPNNITVGIVGEIDLSQAEELAKKYFGRIPAGKQLPPEVITERTSQSGEIYYKAEVDAPPSATVAYHTTAFAAKDDPALQVLASVLSGKTGRLYKRLVLKDKVATSTYASADGRKYDGIFEIVANGSSETDADTLREIILEEVEKIKVEGITAIELQRVRNNLSASKFRRVRANFQFLIQLLYFDGLRNWNIMDDYFEDILNVTEAQVQQAAKDYLTADNRGNKLYSRKKDATPEDPELSKFDDQQKQMIKQMMARVKTVPVDKINTVITQLQSSMGQAPEKAKNAMLYIIKKLQLKANQ